MSEVNKKEVKMPSEKNVRTYTINFNEVSAKGKVKVKTTDLIYSLPEARIQGQMLSKEGRFVSLQNSKGVKLPL